MIKLIFALLSFNVFAEIDTFREAKKVLLELHKDHAETLYCGCKYNHKTIDLKSCGYIPYKDKKWAARLEWEHIVPAAAFGQAFVEWRSGSPKCLNLKKKKLFKGRKCARRNPQFRKMEADLYNLYPEIGELNGIRSNFSMASIPTSERTSKAITFGDCKAVVLDRKFEPMDQAKGIVARIYMYMDQAYPGRGIISNKNEKLFDQWNKNFPVTEWECERAKKIEEIQKNANPILKAACLKFHFKK